MKKKTKRELRGLSDKDGQPFKPGVGAEIPEKITDEKKSSETKNDK